MIVESIDIANYLSGDIYIINDTAYRDKVIFEVKDKDLREFAKSYDDIYTNRGGLFEGDVYFISLLRDESYILSSRRSLVFI